MWHALGEVAQRPDVTVRLYIDIESATSKPGWPTPSADYRNIEFGIKLDNPSLAESVERELPNVEDVLYEKISPTDPTV